MNVWSTRILAGAVAAALAALLAVGVLPGSMSAQAPMPPLGPRTTPICPNYLDLSTVPIDPALIAILTATWDERLNGIELTWSAPRPANCAWVQAKLQPANYSGGGANIAWADWVWAPGSGARFFPAQSAGTHCYRLFALSWAGRTEAKEACVDVPADAVPTPRPPGTAPPPVGTPWPAPIEVRLEGSTFLLDQNNFPLRPEHQAWFSGISWSVLGGFTGTYEVQRARSEPGFDQNWESLRSGQFAASSATNGRIGFEEQVSPFTIWCFRVRANINRETGPFSEPVCMQRPPSSGGIGSGPGTTTPAPLPPVVGNTERLASEGDSFPVPAALAVALIGLATAATLRFKR
jgi:hypothetical protein